MLFLQLDVNANSLSPHGDGLAMNLYYIWTTDSDNLMIELIRIEQKRRGIEEEQR